MPATDGYIGEIYMAGFNFPPRGTASCSGQLLSISQNTALFSLLGTTYGGNGTTNFQLPDLRGRVPMCQGQGNGLTPRTLGEVGGVENVTLTTNQMPAHTHAITVHPQGINVAGDTADPTGNFPANTGALDREYKTPGSATVNMGASAANITPTGGNLPHDNMQPYLVLNFYIILNGVFPSRN